MGLLKIMAFVMDGPVKNNGFSYEWAHNNDFYYG